MGKRFFQSLTSFDSMVRLGFRYNIKVFFVYGNKGTRFLLQFCISEERVINFLSLLTLKVGKGEICCAFSTKVRLNIVCFCYCFQLQKQIYLRFVLFQCQWWYKLAILPGVFIIWFCVCVFNNILHKYATLSF